MKKLSVIFASLVLVLGVSKAVVAQDDNETSHNVSITIPSVALVDVETTGGEASTITLSTPTYGEAGAPLDFSGSIDNSLWLNYTSVIAKDKKRKVTAQIDKTLPVGLSLKLNAAAATGTDKQGTLGSPEDELTLTTSAQDLITEIGSGYTGTGLQGHQLTYFLSMENSKFANLIATDYTLEVTYTIIDK